MQSDSVPLRPAWVEVDLDAIARNTRRVVAMANGAEVVAMVKANAYGHGAIEVSRATLGAGASWLGVVALGEGIELRRAGITAPILVLGYTPPHWMRYAVEHRITPTIASLETARAFADAARAVGAPARVHIKIDTGMSRLGVTPEETLDFARAVGALGIEIEGALTHFSMADTPDAFEVEGWGRAFTQQQLERFQRALDALERAGIHVRYRHCANSPAVINLPASRFNLVRVGILLYGLDPSPEVPRPPGFVPALTFKTEVASVRDVPIGAYVGYGCTFRAERPTRLAVIMVGYADGFRRKPRNYGQVLVRGARAPIVGRVCMDQTMVDVTDIPGVQVGDEVVLIGRQGAEEIRAEEVAERLGTNNYETVTTISARVERRYLGQPPAG